jgi:acyl dehydratase
MTTRWEDLEAGMTPPPFIDAPLTVTDFVRYQGASGDMNPIHHDTAFARAAGFETPFAVGMLQAGVVASYLGDWLGPENVRRLKVQFREQAWPGDVLTYIPTVAGTRVERNTRVVDVEVSVKRQTGTEHLRAWATYAVPDESR